MPLARGPRRSRWLALLVTTAVLGGVASPTWAASCEGAAPTGAVPAEFLRSYRAFLKSPTRLAIDQDDNVYIADPLNGRLVVRAPNGRRLLDLDQLGYPISIAVDSSGTILVGDGRRRRVDSYDADGQPIGYLGAGDNEFNLPAFLAVYEDADGTHVYVVDSGDDLVKRYALPSPEVPGKLEHTFGGTGPEPGSFLLPSGIAVFEGQIYVVDRGNSRLQVFSPDGVLDQVIIPAADSCGFLCQGPSGGRPRDAGIWIGAGGEIYLAEASKGQVVVLGTDGAEIGTVGGFGTTPGRLRVPTDMVIDSCGRLFVASAANARVDIFGLPGFVDPEQYAPGRLTIANGPIDPSADFELVAYLELPGHRLSEVENILANGFAIPISVTIGDGDRDNILDLRLVFGVDLIASLSGSTQADISVTGTIRALKFEESDRVQVVSSDLDLDQDGVADAVDACPHTPPGEPVAADGCSIGERCPCEGPVADEPWRNHGDYVSCIARASREFEAAGIISASERSRLRQQAARSQCGKHGGGNP